MPDLLRPPVIPGGSGTWDPMLADGPTDTVVQLVARQEGLQAALEIAQAILAGQEPSTMWRLFARRARRLLRADATIVRTLGLNGATLVLRGVDPRRSGDGVPGLLVPEEPVTAGLAGAVLQSGRPRILGDLGLHLHEAAEAARAAAAEPDAPGRMPAGPALIVPIGPRAAPIGTLMAVNRVGGPGFGRRDVDLLRSFAGQAAVAVQQAELRRKRQRMMVMEERERLARELHDDAIQSLRDIAAGLQSVADRAEDPVLRERMAGLVQTVDSVIRDLRNHVYGLRPSVLSGRRLDEALRQLASEFEQQSGTSTVADLDAEAAERLREHAGEVVQIVREALSNVGRHANARNCRVSLGVGDGAAWLLVEDDGVGFDPGRTHRRGHGLRNFAERVDRLGGQLEIESRPNAGTALRITIPLRRLPPCRPDQP